MKLPESVKEQIKEIKKEMSLSKKKTKKLKKLAKSQYKKSQVEPGESVGIVAAQSIGEPGTQLTLRTKWLAGATEMSVTQGLPRIIEILDARKNPKTPSMTVSLKSSYSRSRGQVEKIALKILEIKLGDIIESVDVDLGKMRVEIELDKKEMKNLNVNQKTVRKIVKKNQKGKSKVTTGSYKINVRPKEEVSIKDLYKLKVKLKDLKVSGIDGITQVLPVKHGEEWIIKTAGTNLKDVLKMKEVDIKNTTTNHLYEVYKVFGVEATRNWIIEETLSVLGDQGIEVDERHIMLVADVMTSDGTVRGINRYGVSGEKASVLARASFEVPLKHLFNAAMSAEVDDLRSVVENVMINQPVPVGTGLVNLNVKKPGDKKSKEESK